MFYLDTALGVPSVGLKLCNWNSPKQEGAFFTAPLIGPKSITLNNLYPSSFKCVISKIL